MPWHVCTLATTEVRRREPIEKGAALFTGKERRGDTETRLLLLRHLLNTGGYTGAQGNTPRSTGEAAAIHLYDLRA